MSHDAYEITPTRGVKTLDDRLEAMEATLEHIVKTLGVGATSFATIALRVRILEIIVYGACGLGLTSIAGALIFLVIRGAPVVTP